MLEHPNLCPDSHSATTEMQNSTLACYSRLQQDIECLSVWKLPEERFYKFL